MLAAKKKAILIIDESAGRNVAAALGIQCTGLIGVLVEAKLRGFIPHLRPELERLSTGSNFRFTQKLFQSALERAGEV